MPGRHGARPTSGRDLRRSEHHTAEGERGASWQSSPLLARPKHRTVFSTLEFIHGSHVHRQAVDKGTVTQSVSRSVDQSPVYSLIVTLNDRTLARNIPKPWQMSKTSGRILQRLQFYEIHLNILIHLLEKGVIFEIKKYENLRIC